MAAISQNLRRRRAKYMEKMKNEKEEELAMAQRRFDELDKEKTGLLGKEQLRDLLLAVHPGATVDDGMVEYVAHMSQKARLASGEDAGEDGVRLRREDLPPVIRAAKYYLHKSDYVDQIFTQFDVDKTGTLNREQLKQALMHVEREMAKDRAHKSGALFPQEFKITDAELDHILLTSDWDKTSVLSKEEVLFAIALWNYTAKTLAQDESRNRSAVCALL